MKLIYYKIHRFYEVVFKTADSDVYAYVLTSSMLALNLIYIQFGYVLATNPKIKLNELWDLVLIALALLFTYFTFLWKGKHKSLSSESFSKAIRGTLGSILVAMYMIGTVFTVIYIATLAHRYHI